jgi:hypothetical protein
MAVTLSYSGSEKREAARIDCNQPLAYKVCKQETLTKLLEGYTVNISEAGLLCTIQYKVDLWDVMWLSFNRSVLEACEEIERYSIIYQNGVIGQVVRVDDKENGSFSVGVKFLTREEKTAPELGIANNG